MTIDRRTFVGAAGAALAMPAYLRSAYAAEITLNLHHFLPAVSNVQRNVLAPWAERIASETQGRLKIQIFPSMQLGGTPSQLYDQAKDGVVDIAWTLPGYTAGRFPSTEVFELPFIAARSARTNAMAAQEFAGTHLAGEMGDVKLLGFWTHDRGVIHANRPIRTMEDFRGLKLRFPTRLAGEALKALGATSIGMPVPQVPQNLAQRVIDGCVIPWEVVPAVKVQELVKYHTEVPGSPTFYTATFVLAMNKARYEGLPGDLRAAIDKMSGMAYAEIAGRMWDTASNEVLEAVKARGNVVTTITEEEKARWMKTTAPVRDAWVKDMRGRGIDGGKLIEVAEELLAKYA